MTEIIIHAAIAIWWSMAALVFCSLTYEGGGDLLSRLAVAVFWPVIAPLGLAVVLWRVPFKTARTIRTDLRNKRILGEFEQWRKQREGGDQ